MSLRDHYYLVLCLAVLGLSAQMLVDTSTWWIRALGDRERIGTFVSRTNIYNYSGRLFALIFSASIALVIDIGGKPALICLTLAIAFGLCTVLHLLLLNTSEFSQRFLIRIAQLLRLKDVRPVRSVEPEGKDRRLFLITMFATLALTMGASVPYIAASLVPQYRLSLANLGQAINSVGTLLSLLYIDQRLFVSWERDELRHTVVVVCRARVIGFAGACLFFAALAWSQFAGHGELLGHALTAQ